MSTSSSTALPLRAGVTIADMARMVGLSRQRFNALMREGVFPSPVYCLATRRPMYVEEQQQVCLEVRRRHMGVNGRVVMFYPRRPSPPATPKRRTRTSPVSSAAQVPSRHAELLDALRSLGLSPTVQQVEHALRAAYPQGTEGVDENEQIRRVFQQLRRSNSAGNVGG